MARHRKARRGGFYKRAKRRATGMFGQGIMGKAIGVLGYIAYQAFIAPMIPISGMMKSLGELVIGLFLIKKGGWMGSLGAAAVIINLYGLLKAYVFPMFGGMNGSSTSAAY